MITLKQVAKQYGTTMALAPLDLNIQGGETTVLIGPSGCGKSTILRLIMGLVLSDSGSIQLGDIQLAPDTVQTLRRRMGYVIQDGGLFPHLSARHNVTLMASYLGWEPKRIEERLQLLIQLSRFPAGALDRYPVQLSGGQRQRVALMRALMLDPDVLLLDEPLGALDPIIRHELQAELKDIFQTLAKTVVLVTHDMGEAGFFGDRIVMLREGRIVQQGSLQDLLESPAEPFVEQFINAQRSPLATLVTESRGH